MKIEDMEKDELISLLKNMNINVFDNIIKIRNPVDMYKKLSRYINKKQEHFIVITLDANHVIIKSHVSTKGLINKAPVHPREIFAPAISDRAAAIIIAHNHPSGNNDPSIEDRNVTDRMVQAGLIIGIPVLDHIIMSKNGYYSFKENDLL